MFKEIFLGKEKIFSSKVIISHVIFILISFMFVYMFSYSTSFRYDFLGGDSAIFQSVGKFWAQGYLPYVDLFENKGPLLFWINALGYWIYSRSGIMVPQIIFLYLSCLLIWRTMELYSSSAWQKTFFLLVALIFYLAHYEEGNHVEEYSVLFLSAATYCFLRSLKENNFPPFYGFIYGFCFGACVLIRTSDAAQICCQVFLIAIFLLQERAFKNLWQNFLSFCAGFAAIVLPFVIYFAAHDAFYDMVYGTILFNIKYTNEDVYTPLRHKIIYGAFHFLPLFIMIIIATFALKQNLKNRLLQSGIFIGLMMTFMLTNFRTYGHYSMIIFPAMPILFAILQESRNEIQKIWQISGLSFKRIFFKSLILIAVVYICVLTIYVKNLFFAENISLPIPFSTYRKNLEMLNPNEREDILALKNLIPDNERKSFVTWGLYCNITHWILRADMKSRERLFMNNNEMMRINPAFKKEWFDNVRKDYPLWILHGVELDRKPDEPPKTLEENELEQLIEEKYSFKGEVYVWPQMLKLYRLKE